MSKTLAILMVIEKLMTFVFIALLLAKGAAALEVIEVDISWYTVLAPFGINLLLIPISVVVVNRKLRG